MTPVLAGLGAVGAAGASALAWSFVEAQWFTLRQVTVPLLPPDAEPVRILHLADLHLVPRQRRKAGWVRSLANLEPDFVVDTGDNWGDPETLDALVAAFDPLLDLPGAFVMGSNDYFGPTPKNPARYLLRDDRRGAEHAHERELPAEDLRAAFTGRGWLDLNNARASAGIRGSRFSLVGTDDAHIGRDRFPAAQPGPAPADGAVALGVTHAPYRRVLQAMHDDGVRLTFAGHTHGGQLAVPGYGALVTNCDLDTRRAKGLHGWPGLRPDAPGGDQSMWLHVSAGLGTSPYTPVRFACRPEATLLTLTPAEPPAAQ